MHDFERDLFISVGITGGQNSPERTSDSNGSEDNGDFKIHDGGLLLRYFGREGLG